MVVSWCWEQEALGHSAVVAQLVKNPFALQETPVPFLGRGRSPGEGIGYPLQYSLASLVTQLVTCSAGDLGWEDPLEKGTATHSSILSGELCGLYI